MKRLKKKQRTRQMRLQAKRAARRERDKTRPGLHRKQRKHHNEISATYKHTDSGTKMYPIAGRCDPSHGSLKHKRGVNG